MTRPLSTKSLTERPMNDKTAIAREFSKPPSESWWIKADRSKFTERAKAEETRLRNSMGANLVNSATGSVLDRRSK